MFELKLLPFKLDGLIFDDIFYPVSNPFIPRKDEIIETKLRVDVGNENDDIYLLKIKVISVNYEINDCLKLETIIYGKVIQANKLESGE